MVQAYWDIGKLIVEEEQNGKHRAEYVEAVLETLSIRLTEEYGKNFSNRNLRYIRQFFIAFPKRNALRSELSRTHYRLLLKVEKEDAKDFYMQESTECNWNTRTLERQINSLYYERMLLTQKKGKELVKAEAESKKEIKQQMDDPGFREKINDLMKIKEEAASSDAWFQEAYPVAQLKTVAYFSIEYMLSEVLPMRKNYRFWLQNKKSLSKALYATLKNGTKIEIAYFFNNLTTQENEQLQHWMNAFELKILTDENLRKKVGEDLN